MNLKKEKYWQTTFDFYFNTPSSSVSNITEKNVDSTPYIDLGRWGFVFFRERDPFRDRRLAVANTPSSFLQDAKTTKGERIYHTLYVKFFFDRVDKNSPISHELVKLGERVEKPVLRDRENVDTEKYIIKNVPRNLSSKEYQYIENTINDFHSFSLPF